MMKNRLLRGHVLKLFGIVCFTQIIATNQSNAQTILINQDFSTATGFTAPTGWTNVSNNTADQWSFDDDCGRLGADMQVGTSGMSGTIAILDSDCTGDDHDADLTTPVFDASLPGSYRLEFDNSILNYAVQLCEVQVWNGTVWTTVLSVDGISDGGFAANHKTIDITAATGNSSTAQVRFHYEGDYEWWWAIDNVKITRLSCAVPQATYTIVPNCTSGQFSVSVNISSLGSATSVAIKEGTTTFATATATGTYTAGPFVSGSGHTLTLEHNLNILCSVNSDNQSYYCEASNDECSSAVDISNQLPVNGSNASATQSSLDGGLCSDGLGANDVWYKVTALSSGPINVLQLVPNEDDLVLEVLSGTCTSPVEIDCDASSWLAGINQITFTATAGTTYFIRTYGYSGQEEGDFTIQVWGTPLPVTMDKLSGKLTSGNIAQLSWNTFSEQNNKGFEIQRSADGKTFKSAGFVTSKANAGNSTEQINYGFTDREVVSGAVYYRLQQTDIDGKTAYSNIVRLASKENGGFDVVVAPNPVKNSLTVNTYGVQGKDAKVYLADITGKMVKMIMVTGAETTVDMTELPQGIYLVKYIDADHNQTIKVSKQ